MKVRGNTGFEVSLNMEIPPQGILRRNGDVYSSLPAMQIDISEITKLTRDRNTSIRLVREYQRKYKGRSSVWVVERIISDLQRDRGSVAKVPTIRTRSNQRQGYSPNSEVLTSIAIWIGLGIAGIAGMYANDLHRELPGHSFSNTRSTYRGATYQSWVLPAPHQYQQIQHGTVVRMQNSSPERMKVTLKSLDTGSKYTFDIAACRGCSYQYEGNLPEYCEDTGPTHALTVPYGEYDATIDFLGSTRTGKGHWYFHDGWEYFGCYYSIYGAGHRY